MQNNNPKHFLSETEFVQLRVELAAASTTNGEGETPSEELPPGVEDLPDPAKVRAKPSDPCGGPGASDASEHPRTNHENTLL